MVTTILVWILWGLAGILGLLVILINLPYRARATAEWDDDHLDAEIFVGWPLRLLGVMATISFERRCFGFYFLGLRLKTWPLDELKEKRDKKKSASGEKRKKRSGRSKKKKLSLTDPALGLHLSRMPHKGYALGKIADWLSMRASLQGRFGFDDPYTTGQAALALILLQTVFPSLGRQVEFEYVDPVLEGRLDLSMTAWLPRIVAGVIVFLLSRKGRAMRRHYLARPKPAQTTA